MICKDTDEIARKLKHNGIEISWMQLMNRVCFIENQIKYVEKVRL